MLNKNFRPTVLCIYDGFGIGLKNKGNAVTQAKLLVFDSLWKKYPHTLLQASGKYVGLPPRQAGNSEAGHMNIGGGRIVEQDSTRVTASIEDGTFFKNPAFLGVIKHLRRNKSNLHLMGLLCNSQSAHADPKHLQALLKMANDHGVKKVFLHLFTDGRDSPPYLSIKLLRRLKNSFQNGEIVATIMGRFYGMDRKKAWTRTEQAYNAMVLGRGYKVDNSEDAILHAYGRRETDEFIPPSVIYYDGRPSGLIDDNDAVIFFNLRSDRARQMTKPFVQTDFEEHGGFKRKKVLQNLYFVALTDFGPDLDLVISAFPSGDLTGSLTMALSGQKQLYIAEEEKYAHVTYFINGGYADPVAGEDRVKIPSVKEAHYDRRPEMSAKKITNYVLADLKKKKHNFICLNFANPDMLAHTGNLRATIKGLEIVDACLGKIYEVIKFYHGNLIMTADHGNCDWMRDEKTGEVVTEHSRNPVPFILASPSLKNKKLKWAGYLGNVAPTILDVMDIKKPTEMTGTSLIK